MKMNLEQVVLVEKIAEKMYLWNKNFFVIITPLNDHKITWRQSNLIDYYSQLISLLFNMFILGISHRFNIVKDKTYIFKYYIRLIFLNINGYSVDLI